MKIRYLLGLLCFIAALIVSAKLWEFGSYIQSRRTATGTARERRKSDKKTHEEAR
jgi:hypothetical protein